MLYLHKVAIRRVDRVRGRARICQVRAGLPPSDSSRAWEDHVVSGGILLGSSGLVYWNAGVKGC